MLNGRMIYILLFLFSADGGQDGLPADGGILRRRPGGRLRALRALEGRPAGAQEEELPPTSQHSGEDGQWSLSMVNGTAGGGRVRAGD